MKIKTKEVYHSNMGRVMTKLVLWCSLSKPPSTDALIVFWNQYISEEEQTNGKISLPQLIRDDTDYWKSRYLLWLKNIGNMTFSGSTLVDRLLIRPGLSYWWMTIPTEYSFSTKSIAYSTIRLWALARILEEHIVDELQVVGANPELEVVFQIWGSKNGCQITFEQEEEGSSTFSHKESVRARIKKIVPLPIQGIGYLIFEYFKYFSVPRPKPSDRPTTSGHITIIDDLAHCDLSVAQFGRYESHYWGGLAEVLESSDLSLNWLHLDLRTSTLPTIKSSKRVVEKLNPNSRDPHHFLLQNGLTLKVLCRSVMTFFRIRHITRKFSSQICWQDPISNMDIYALVKPVLNSDFNGTGAARNALWMSLFDEFFKSLPKNNTCIYLMENQSFELALLNAWSDRLSAPILGFVHGPVREWDLRCALGTNSNVTMRSKNLPTPNLICVNGPLAERVLLENGIPPELLTSIEALRYEPVSESIEHSLFDRPTDPSGLRILMVGEYEDELLHQQLLLLGELCEFLPSSFALTFRPHPGSAVSLEDVPRGAHLSSERMFGRDLDKCDLVIASNVSNAALDAYLRGIRVIMQGDGRVLNGTPVPKEAHIKMILTAADILTTLRLVEEEHNYNITIDTLFNIDPHLPRWRTLLNL
jgi:surface carbohydrate biosynthesis protein (TIGR04326 family)